MKTARAWLLLCALHGVVSMLLWWARSSTVETLIWRADSWTDRPWALWTSAWVHVNTPHLIVNQVALGALTAFAWIIRPTLASAVAWWFCWPLIQLSMLYWPQVGYAVGLSGLLHAGAMVLAVQLLRRRIVISKARRWGGLLLLGLAVELLTERGWAYPVVWDDGNGTSVVQAAHLAGAFWGLCLGLLASWWPAPRPRTRSVTVPSVTENVQP